MKLYIKNGKILPKNRIIITKEDQSIYNPGEDLIIENGWKEYIKPELEETLESVKESVKNEIISFDCSDSVNEFFISEQSVWLDKNTRTGLMLRFQAERNSGSIETTLWYEGKSFDLNIEEAIEMLYSLELYASQCYDNTQRHLSNVDKLETIEEVKSYDYYIGYPEKLRF